MITTKIRNKNGNYWYFLYPDGTKIRQSIDKYFPEYPETLDIKITNYCDMNCQFCHEKSDIFGKHCDWNKSILDGLPKGVEIALGGGNPLSHPKIIEIVNDIKKAGLIPNITINTNHLIQKKYQKILDKMKYNALGISYTDNFYKIPKKYINEKTVWHFINKVHSLKEMKELIKKYPNLKALILGYKKFGRGINFNPLYKYGLKDIKKLNFKITAFDNLGVKQFNIVDDNYMGDDGEFSFYVDLVENKFGKASFIKKRFKMLKTIKKSFKKLITI